MKLDYDRALIKKGNPKHTHHFLVDSDDIGRCSCGREIDYTILFEKIPQCRIGKLFRDNVTMSQIGKSIRTQ